MVEKKGRDKIRTGYIIAHLQKLSSTVNFSLVSPRQFY